MKKSNIISVSAAGLVALIAVSGIAFSTFASNGNANGNSNRPEDMPPRGWQKNMTDEEKAEWQEKIEAMRAERESQREAVIAAIEAGSYSDWVEAMPENSPILEKITADNFARFVEMHNLRQEANAIALELGIDRGGMGFGQGRGGFDKGMRKGGKGCPFHAEE